MKSRVFRLFLIVCFGFDAYAQSSSNDSNYRREISTNLAPAIMILGGSAPSAASIGLTYRQYYKNKRVFKVGLALFPFRQYNSYFGLQYNRTVGLKNIFVSYNNYYTAKSQLNLGVEKLFRFKKLIHGFGADLLFSHQIRHYSENYMWRNITNTQNQFFTYGDSTDYSIDTLGYRANETQLGVGLQLNYSLRYQINKRFYILLTAGPSLWYVKIDGNYNDYATNTRTAINDGFLYFTITPIVTEFALCYRF